MIPFGWRDAFEVLIFWIGIYALMRFLKGTRGLGILKGATLFILSLYLLSKWIEWQFSVQLSRLNFLIEHLVTVAIMAFIIIFQPEVRRGLTRLGEKPFAWIGSREATQSITPIAEAAGRMSRRRIGALIVLERTTGLGQIVERGSLLNAEVTQDLLESIFYPNSPLHDGAAVIRGDRVVAARCTLPLSDNPDLPTEFGTRHRAAIGLTEETDAIVVVVSEQSGRISVVHRGAIRAQRDARDLEATLTTLLSGGELQSATSDRSGSSSAVHGTGSRARPDTQTAYFERDLTQTQPIRPLARPGRGSDPSHPGRGSDPSNGGRGGDASNSGRAGDAAKKATGSFGVGGSVPTQNRDEPNQEDIP